MDSDVSDTNVENDFSRGVRDEAEGQLRKGLSRGKGARGATNITYLRIRGPKADNPRVLYKPLFFRLFWPTDGSRVNDVAAVFM